MTNVHILDAGFEGSALLCEEGNIKAVTRCPWGDVPKKVKSSVSRAFSPTRYARVCVVMGVRARENGRARERMGTQFEDICYYTDQIYTRFEQLTQHSGDYITSARYALSFSLLLSCSLSARTRSLSHDTHSFFPFCLFCACALSICLVALIHSLTHPLTRPPSSHTPTAANHPSKARAHWGVGS